ncbi:Tyrosine-protein kinase wzc [termite gut metagenome]|uniref:Tyrosine-protein kinase wzc n=1 Tax=termite gut metagenome TaxID=433724 RepID=A0A5J4R8M2_9ZZZZ
MKDNNLNNSRNGIIEEDNIDLVTLFLKYLSYWKWYLIAVIACILLACIYLRHSTPVYNISGMVLIKDENRKGANVGMTMIENFGLMNSTANNLDNEIEIIRSKTVIKNVVEELKLYISYYAKNGFSSINLYPHPPVQVSMTVTDAEALKKYLTIRMKLNSDSTLNVSAAIPNGKMGREEMKKCFNSLPGIWVTPAGTLIFTFPQYETVANEKIGEVKEIEVIISRPSVVAKKYLANLNVQPSSQKTSTSIVSISYKSSNKQHGEDFVNKLIKVYNWNTNNSKNEIAEKTKEFIDERLQIINGELGSTEQQLQVFKQDAGLTNLNSDAQLALTENSAYEKKRVETEMQLSLIHYLSERVNESQSWNRALPMNIGLEDKSLSELIVQYNQLIADRNRLSRTSSENNPAFVTLNGNVQSMLSSIKTTVISIEEGLKINKQALDRQAQKFTRKINSAPAQEREFLSISRQQEIKANLYLMLLQKREENAIALAATTDNAQVIDPAIADENPISPKKLIILIGALLLGLTIPTGLIYLLDAIRYKIVDRSDVEKLSHLPIIGEIPIDINKEETGTIVIKENDNNLMMEVFRDLRTNLQFIMGDTGKKVLLSTSTVTNEGKTFISSNLAVSFSLLGKKVVLVGLDIRNPELHTIFKFPFKKEGISSYLANPDSCDLFSLIVPSGVSPNLSILPGGTIPPNPTELLARPALDSAFNKLKERFDYVIIDTAPIGVVSDTQIISRVADACLYICRTNYSHKSNLHLANELHDSHKLPNISIVINGIDLTRKHYGYYGKYGRYGGAYGRYGHKRYGYGQANAVQP